MQSTFQIFQGISFLSLLFEGDCIDNGILLVLRKLYLILSINVPFFVFPLLLVLLTFAMINNVFSPFLVYITFQHIAKLYLFNSQ